MTKPAKLFSHYRRRHMVPQATIIALRKILVLCYLTLVHPFRNKITNRSQITQHNLFAKLNPSSNSRFSQELSWLYYESDPATRPPCNIFQLNFVVRFSFTHTNIVMFCHVYNKTIYTSGSNFNQPSITPALLSLAHPHKLSKAKEGL